MTHVKVPKCSAPTEAQRRETRTHTARCTSGKLQLRFRLLDIASVHCTHVISPPET
jgi:hypothetical protein